MFLRICVLLTLLFTAATNKQLAADEYNPEIKPASNEGELAISGFAVAEGMRAELVAAEPMFANPIAFCLDLQGNIYIAETFRQGKGIEDNRNHMYWLEDDLKAQTVADRVAYIKKHHPEDLAHYTSEDDRIRMLIDEDGDGEMDRSTIFADGFNQIESGSGAGLLHHNGTLYFTCIPDLWALKDVDGDGIADERESLSTGYGVRFAFRGHDMHGLTLGPDGRLYFSIGDRGFHVITKEGKKLHKPDTGAVFRCEFDGSQLELFAYGLRNPQELAFDDFGNLFTGDNNSDSGDQARWVQVCEGMDAGWRMYYQYLDDRGPWNRERMWYPYRESEQTTNIQPAYIVPPIANLGDGPSGLVAYPGVGLSEEYQGHFFMADFRGTASRSGIRSFANKPKGAGFELVDSQQFLWSILATDVDFGFDGRIYATDWVNGWNGEGKGRLYGFTDETYGTTEIIKRNQELFREGFAGRTISELIGYLSNPDRRVRLYAQYELAKLGASNQLAAVVESSANLPAKVHAIQGLGQIARRQTIDYQHILALFDKADDDELVAQLCQVLGDGRVAAAGPRLIELLQHENPRVIHHAAIALGKLKLNQAVPELLEAITANGDEDPVLRHALVMGLKGCSTPDEIVALAKDSSRPLEPAQATAAILAMRRWQDPRIAAFLPDNSLEVARAINDVPIQEATEDLARFELTADAERALAFRVINANFVVGKKSEAERLVAMVSAGPLSNAQEMKEQALEMLLNWENPSEFDLVTNQYRPLARGRDVGFMPELLAPVVPQLLSASEQGAKPNSANTRLLAIQLIGQYGLTSETGSLKGLFANTDEALELRKAALTALDRLDVPAFDELLVKAVQDKDASIRSLARNLLLKNAPEKAIGFLVDALEEGSLTEQQDAVHALAGIQSDEAKEILLGQFDKMIAGKVAEGLKLDLLMAAEQLGGDAFGEKLTAYHKTKADSDELKEFREALFGGDVARGREVFFGRAAASCRRCHVVDGEGGGVGPDLSAIAKTKDRTYLLESIVLPNKAIAKGFETALLVLFDGKTVSGIVKSEDDETITLVKPMGEEVRVNKDDVDLRAEGKSGMPEDLTKTLTKSEIRDLVAYLSTLKGKKGRASHGNEEG